MIPRWAVLIVLAGCLVVRMAVAAPPSERAPAEPAAKTSKAPPGRAELEKKFAQALSGATLAGHFTETGQKLANPKEERYTIAKVTKLKGDYWLFQTRIQYGQHDVTLPLPLEVKWAADTPVITLTDVGIPGFGTFTARVLIFRDQYAGTWSGANHGGHLFGNITRGAAAPAVPAVAPPVESRAPSAPAAEAPATPR